MTGSSTRAVLFVANGRAGSAAAERAERFAASTAARTQVLVRHAGRARSIASMIMKARGFSPDLVYCVDLAAVPISVGILARERSLLVVDTGDHPSAFFRQIGAGVGKVAAAKAMEEFAYRKAAAIVVRNRHHAAVVRGHGARQVAVIPDGVDMEMVKSLTDDKLRAQLRLDRVFTVGIAGHFTWYGRLGGGLGSELVRALAQLRDVPVHGLLVGDGPGLGNLRVLASRLGVSDRLHVLGRIPYSEYARYISLMDVCLLTQTNDPSSWIRTTGKLPAYMAASRYILASAVGTAVDVLPPTMLIPYEGRWDDNYPNRLAKHIRSLVMQPDRLADGEALRQKATPFSYPKVAGQAGQLIEHLLNATPA